MFIEKINNINNIKEIHYESKFDYVSNDPHIMMFMTNLGYI
jgi:hypothetical protein